MLILLMLLMMLLTLQMLLVLPLLLVLAPIATAALGVRSYHIQYYQIISIIILLCTDPAYASAAPALTAGPVASAPVINPAVAYAAVLLL